MNDVIGSFSFRFKCNEWWLLFELMSLVMGVCDTWSLLYLVKFLCYCFLALLSFVFLIMDHCVCQSVKLLIALVVLLCVLFINVSLYLFVFFF